MYDYSRPFVSYWLLKLAAAFDTFQFAAILRDKPPWEE
jgi:hypothetical protein